MRLLRRGRRRRALGGQPGQPRTGRLAGFLTLLRHRGVLLHIVTHGRTYDTQRGHDWKELATTGVDSAYESEKTSERALRSAASRKAAGRPMGRAPYGYQRVYDSSTGKLAGQEPDERAPAVAQYFTDLSAGVPVRGSCPDSPRDPPGRPGDRPQLRLRRAAARPGRRAGIECSLAGDRPPEDTWHRVQEILDGHRGAGSHPSSYRSLLAYLATCGVCGEPVVTHKARDRYRCRKGCCTHRTIDEADLHVEFRLADLLAQEGAMEQFIRSDDTAAVAARSEAARLRQRLDEARTGYAAGQIGFEALARVEQDLVPAVEAAEETARTIPAALHPLAGMDRWQDIWLIIQAMPVGGLREVIRVLCDVKLYPGRRLEVVLRELPG